MAIIKTGQTLKKIEQKIDLSYERYRFWRNILGITSFTSFFINPLLSIPTIYLTNYFHLKMKENSPDNITIYGKKLHVLGQDPDLPKYAWQWGGGDFITGKGASGIYFGQDEYGLPIHLNDKNGLQTHGIIFGATGAGKTVSLFNIMMQQTRRGGGFIFIDGKSENPTWINVYEIALEADRADEIFLLSFRASEEAQSNSWNILMSGASNQIGEMLSELALPEDAGQNQIFVERGKQLMYGILSAMTYFRDVLKEIVTLNDLINMLKPMCLLAMLRPTKEDVLKDEKTRPYAKYWIPEDYVEEGMSQTAKDMLRNFAENIGASRDGYVGKEQEKLYTDQHSFAAMQFGPALSDLANTYGKIFNTTISDISIDDIVRNNRIMYVLLPSLEKSTKSLEGIGKMVLSAVKQAAAATLGGKTEGDKAEMNKETRKGRPKPPFLVIPDEYGSYAIKGFSDVLAQARSLGLGVIISVQEKASFEKAGQEEAKRIFGNTRFKIGLNVADKDTKEYLAQQAGKVHVYMKQSEEVDRFQVYGDKLKTKEQFSIQEVDVITPIEFERFGPGEGVFLFFGELRKFKTPYYNPEETDKVRLNDLYPTVKLSIKEEEEEEINEVENLNEEINNPWD